MICSGFYFSLFVHWCRVGTFFGAVDPQCANCDVLCVLLFFISEKTKIACWFRGKNCLNLVKSFCGLKVIESHLYGLLRLWKKIFLGTEIKKKIYSICKFYNFYHNNANNNNNDTPSALLNLSNFAKQKNQGSSFVTLVFQMKSYFL